MKPIIFVEGINSKKDLDIFIQKQRGLRVQDFYESQQIELFVIRNPSMNKLSNDFQDNLSQYLSALNTDKEKLFGTWVYYPWNKNLVHIVNENEYLELRTNRNRDLITKDEQLKLYNTNIGIIGLSIGSGIATTLEFQGIGKIKGIADFDTLETTNLNRIKSTLFDLGNKKTDIVAKYIYEVNPFADLKLFDRGIKDKDIKAYFDVVNPRIIFEAIDDLRMKILLRIEAQKRKVPVVMFTNIGDRVMIDVERYDKTSNIKMFNGLDVDIISKIVGNQMKLEEVNKYVIKIVGIDNVPAKVLMSVKEVGNTLVGRPQLVSTVTVSSGLAGYVAKQIILYNSIETGRYHLKFNETFKIEEI